MHGSSDQGDVRSPGGRRRALLVVGALGVLVCACAIGNEPAAPAVLSGPSEACGACHEQAAVDVRRSLEHRSGEGCFSCHRPHAGPGEGQGPAGTSASCEDCHAAERAEFFLPFHHPLENGIECTSCHPPHGLEPRRLREHLRFDACVECHREYRGPYMFEHEGDRNLLCLSCHLPHGSPNRRLLTHAESRMLCQSCHANLEDIHRQNPGSIFRDCLTCHTEIHGSNWDRELFR